MSIAISDYLPGYALNGTNAEFDLASFPSLTADEVDITANGGDMVEFTFALLERFAQSYLARSANGDPLPSGQTLTKSPPSNGGGSNLLNQTYTLATTLVVDYADTDQPS